MRLERVVHDCIGFLRRSTNPLVPLDTLYTVCVGEGTNLSKEDLLAFLRNHAEVLVIEGADESLPVSPSEFSGAGINMGPRVILKERMPSREEMTDIMRQQLEHMRLHLGHALDKARANNDLDAVREIEAALERGALLEAKMQHFLKP